MGFRLFTTICLILIIAVATRMLTDQGWVPWAAACALIVLAFMAQGLMAKRKRGTQTPQQTDPDTVEGRKVVLGVSEGDGPPPTT